MLPKLLGPFRQATCQKCGHSWKIAAETFRDNERPVPCNVCQSNCFVHKVQPGQQITALQLRPEQQPDRLDCVVFQSSDDDLADSNPSGSNQSVSDPSSGNWACKRIWGLPGEAIEFRRGEILIDGQTFQKSVQQMRQVTIPISSYPGDRSDLFSVLRNGSAAVEDLQDAQEFRRPAIAEAPRDEAAKFDLNSIRSDSLRLETGDIVEWSRSVVDDYPEDFSTPRNLITVDDLLFEIEFETSSGPKDGNLASRSSSSGIDRETPTTPASALVLEVAYQGRRLEIDCLLDFENQPDTTSGLPARAHENRNVEVKPNTLVNPRRIYCGGWDGRMFCAVDDNDSPMPVQLANREKKPKLEPSSSKTQFRLTVKNGPVQIKRLAVLRDLYLRPNERDTTNGQPEPTLLGENEFFVIGDNLPISIDSRNGMGTLRRQNIWGIIE